MIIIDIVFFALLILSIFIGIKKGLIKQIGNIATVILSFLLALKFYGPFSMFLSIYIPMQGYILQIISFLILFVLLGLFLYASIFIIHRMVYNTPLIMLDKIGGILFALVLYVFVVFIIIYGLSVMPLPEQFIISLKDTIAFKVVDFILNNPNIKNVYSR